MSALTETEIFSCLHENLRGAADDCDMIARFPQSGVAFDRMRKRLGLVEGACKQAAVWREDARWLALGMVMEDVHQRARTLLHRPSVATKKFFPKLSALLRKLAADAQTLETAATGRVGMILPEAQPHARENRPVQVLSPGGLILPPGVSVQ